METCRALDPLPALRNLRKGQNNFLLPKGTKTSVSPLSPKTLSLLYNKTKIEKRQMVFIKTGTGIKRKTSLFSGLLVWRMCHLSGVGVASILLNLFVGSLENRCSSRKFHFPWSFRKSRRSRKVHFPFNTWMVMLTSRSARAPVNVCMWIPP